MSARRFQSGETSEHELSRAGVGPGAEPSSVRVAFQAAGVPAALRSEKQWVGWRPKPAPKPGAKIGKVPVNPHTGRDASSTDPETWGTFDEAVAAVQRNGLAGVGFVFTKESSVVGVDLDKCRDADTGAIEPWAQEIVASLSSYSEVSPTGTGIHVLLRGKLPPRGRRRGNVEMYDSGRFFTVTGVPLPGCSEGVEQRDDELLGVHAHWIAAKTSPPVAPTNDGEVASLRAPSASNSPWTPVNSPIPTSDEALLAAARRAKNGAKFSVLFDQGRTDGYASPSEADGGLVALLAFWTGPDPDRIDRLFRASKLMRAKWDEARGEETYGALTIRNVLATTTTCFDPSSSKRGARPWRCKLGGVELTCEPLGAQMAQVRAKSPNGNELVDKFQLTAHSGRQRVAQRISALTSGVTTAAVADALERLAAHVLDCRQEAADGAYGADGVSGDHHSDSDATVLAQLLIESEDIELFHTPGQHDADAYATVRRDGHYETWPVRSHAFRLLAVRMFREHEQRVPAANAVADAINTVEANALFDGAERAVAMRVAGHQGEVWIDLVDDDWRAVRVTERGWEIVGSDKTPVKFVRKRGMQALPTPVAGGAIDDLRPLVNLPDDVAWRLFVLALTTYLLPKGPYVVLVVNGEQGSAKSTLLRVARSLVDPGKAGLRRPPRDEHELMIAASNGWILAYDNISHLSAPLSDALCSLATGGGFGARELYTDGDEKLFEAMRPVMLNGIEDVATRADLLDRAVVLTLPSIADEARMEDAEHRLRLERALPGVFGALLDGVAAVLRGRRSVKLARKPRMADFAISAVAAGAAFGWTREQVLDAIESNRAGTNDAALSNSPVARGIEKLLEHSPHWTGTCDGLLRSLSGLDSELDRKRLGWPANARAMRGALTRAAPNLRRAGIDIDFSVVGHERAREVRLSKLRTRPSAPSAPYARGAGDPTNAVLGQIPAGGRSDGARRPSAADRPQSERFGVGADDAYGVSGVGTPPEDGLPSARVCPRCGEASLFQSPSGIGGCAICDGAGMGDPEGGAA
ncbi:MAG: hypothetical protein JNN27_00520 [Planctomycetes bacterium]|nr:hypothetical protein [Planctomycetota bacterium]